MSGGGMSGGGMSGAGALTALVVIDVQEGFDDPSWGPSNTPEAETRIEQLVDAWERRGLPVVVVRHDSAEPASPLRPGRPGNALKPFLLGRGDVLVSKSVHSAFHGDPDLDGWLRGHGVGAVTVCGITTNHCCETTSRVACDLGYDVTFAWDATRTFDRAAPDGSVLTAAELTRVTRANLDGEFARVLDTATVLRGLAG
jgi:nicotinamidase-related amidase